MTLTSRKCPRSSSITSRGEATILPSWIRPGTRLNVPPRSETHFKEQGMQPLYTTCPYLPLTINVIHHYWPSLQHSNSHEASIQPPIPAFKGPKKPERSNGKSHNPLPSSCPRYSGQRYPHLLWILNDNLVQPSTWSTSSLTDLRNTICGRY